MRREAACLPEKQRIDRFRGRLFTDDVLSVVRIHGNVTAVFSLNVWEKCELEDSNVQVNRNVLIKYQVFLECLRCIRPRRRRHSAWTYGREQVT